MAAGIATVDEQHRRLLEIFNRIALVQAQDASSETVLVLLDELAGYTRYHFREEERLMRQWRVDARHCTMHFKAHESFRGFLRRALTLANEQVTDITVELMAFLAQWLLHHIMEVDQRMARAIRALQAGEAPDGVDLEGTGDEKNDVADTVSQLSEHLGRRTFDLLAQRKQLLNLQALYRALLHCSDVLIQSRREPEMLESLCGKLVQDTPFHTAWLGKPGESDVFDVLAFATTAADRALTAPAKSTERQTASILVRAWQEQKPVACNDTSADSATGSCPEGFAADRRRSVLALPVMRAQRIWAILLLASSRRGCFDAPTIEVCSRIAGLLGHGIDELDAKTRLRARQAQDARIARTDMLTGLPNRLALEEYVPQAIARARRGGTALAVGVIDLDDFKPVNDRLGHEGGDELLRQISRGLLVCMREADFIARLGGDEFVVILEGLDVTRAQSELGAALERLHRAVEEPFRLGAAEAVSIDMTMGVALYPADGEEPEFLLRQADAAMFQAKQSKQARQQWWKLGVTASPEQDAETSFDAFGEETRELLKALAPTIGVMAERFSASFYRELRAHPQNAPVLGSLSTAECQRLARTQADHLRFLLDARATRQAVAQAAQSLGVVHALIGVSGAWMTRALGLYRDLLRTHLDEALLTARTRYRTLRAADARLQLDIESQMQAMQATLDQYQMLFARPMDSRALTPDWIQAELDAVAALPGIRATVVWRPDVQNRLVVERAAGGGAQAFVEALRERDLYPTLDPRDARGKGLVATTWMTDSQQDTSAFALEMREQPWQALMQQLGIRSAVTLPVHRHGAIHAVLMLFGAYAQQFASGWMHTWRQSLQNRWDLLTTVSHNRWHPIDTGQAAQIRALLYSGGVQMFVQPIVNLRDGALVKVEALARLRTPAGTVLDPGQFLPTLGEADLNSLLRQGLAQGLGHLRRWREEKLDIGLSINLAPSSLLHPDCARWIEEALRETQVEPRHLTLELLEGQALEACMVDEAITRLASTGVRIAMDDLGAGFSNFKRLADLPFHVIKIDQNIIKDLRHDPLKALSLIRTVVQIGQDLERDVIAEGLEDAGTIEAATRLGCRFGQGYGLARPMPAEALPDWSKARPVQGGGADELHSWLGALACQWMLMHDPLHLRQPGELDACPLTRFLAARQICDPVVLGLHRQIHESALEPARTQATRQMMQWLTRQVHAG